MMGIRHFLAGVIVCCCLFVQTVTGQVYNYYYGNIHAHTGYSDGNQGANSAYNSARACYQYARQSLHTDYFGISEHNHSMAGMVKSDYHRGILEADSVNQNNVFSTLFGMEYGVINNGGHVLVYGIDSLIGWEAGNYDIYNSEYDYNSLFNLIASRQNAFAYLAHMNTTDYGDLLSQPYNATWDQAIVGLAMRSGPAFSTDTTYSNPSSSTYNTRFQDLLKKGYHVSVGMDEDNHYITFDRASKGRTVVLAMSLTRANILDAFRNRRFYASDDWNAHADFRINNHVMGTIFSDVNNPALSISLSDPDGESITGIKIWYGIPGSGVTATVLTSNTNSSSLNFTHSISNGSSYYYYAEITQADGDKIWTAPIWVTKTASPLPVELIQFDAEKVNKSVALTWTTSAEINNDHFAIMRAGPENIFSEIHEVPGNGNATYFHSYSYTDNNPLAGINYYRLDQIDFDGRVNSLKTTAVDFSGKIFDVAFFSNPFPGNQISFAVQSANKASITAEIYNSIGTLVFSSSMDVNKGFNNYTLKDQFFSQGIYLVKITEPVSGESVTGKIMTGGF